MSIFNYTRDDIFDKIIKEIKTLFNCIIEIMCNKLYSVTFVKYFIPKFIHYKEIVISICENRIDKCDILIEFDCMSKFLCEVLKLFKAYESSLLKKYIENFTCL